jgi:hypothetical protein
MLQALYAGILDQLDRDPYLLRLMVYSALEQHPLARRLHAPGMRLYRILESFIVDGQRRGRFERGSPAVLVRAILALPIYYVMQRRLFRTPWPAADRDDLIATGIRMTLAGLTASTDRDEELS